MSFRLNWDSYQVFDIHVAAWRDGATGEVCLGYDESVSGYTACTCGGRRTIMLLEQAMVAVGMAVVSARILAQMAGPYMEQLLLAI